MNDWSHAEQHAEKAQRFYDAGQWDQALDELRRALEANPYQGDWHYGMGLTLEAMRRYDEATAAFEQALRLRGREDIETLLHLGVDLIRIDQPGRAIEALERAARLDPDCEPAYCHQILAYTQLHEHEQAELSFYLARQLVDECPACYDHIAHSLAMRGQYERAIWCWQQTLRLEPEHPHALASLAIAHARLGRPELARQALTRHLRRAPEDLASLLELARLLADMGRLSDAAQRLRQALALDPTRAETHHQLGEVALRRGWIDTADSHLRRARHLDPMRPGVALALAQVARRRGQLRRARELAKLEARQQGRGPEQLLQLVHHLVELGLPEAALDVLEPALTGNAPTAMATPRQRGRALMQRSRACLMLEQYDEAVEAARQARRKLGSSGDVLLRVAHVHAEAGLLTRARVLLRQARRHGGDRLACRSLARRIMWTRCRRWLTRI
ncbi:MAG: tetratricopeptide repeat protein [Phycisphaeraceae bacterium]